MNVFLMILLMLNLALICANLIKAKQLYKREKEIKKEIQNKNISKEYYNLAKEANYEISKIKHNIKNQIQIAYVAFKQNKVEGMNILKDIEIEIKDVGTTVYCKNEALNAILSVKMAKAKKLNIKMEITVDASIEVDMEELDICDIFSNILDNSIEATKDVKDKYIHLYIYKKTNYIIIKCENTYKEVIKTKSGNYKTTKKEKRKHGYGLKTVEDIVNKYEGEMNIQVKDDIFKLIILIPENIKKGKKMY